MTLNNVVLPAPFGPIRATTSPASTEKETRSSATTPPKRTLSSRTSSSAISAKVYKPAARLANNRLARGSRAVRQAQRQGPGAGIQKASREARLELSRKGARRAGPLQPLRKRSSPVQRAAQVKRPAPPRLSGLRLPRRKEALPAARPAAGGGREPRAA